MLVGGGKIVIMVDNSPSAMILPTSIFDIVEGGKRLLFSDFNRRVS